MGKLTTLVLLALSLGMTARAQLIVGGGGPCVLSGSQTSGYVLTATDGAQGCSWQTAGGASVDANTIKNAVYCPDTSGSANTITCAPTTTFPSSYAAGQSVWVLVANSNSGAATINVKSLGAKAVTKNGATALASGNLIANHAYLMMYDGTQFQVLTYTPLATDIPTLAPLASPTFTGTVSGITATMVGLGSVTNDAQTKAAIVPNTAPSAGQMLVGNAGGTAYAPVTMSGSCTMASTGAISCSGSGASTTLNNLGTTSINAALLFQTGLSLGSASAPPQNLFLYGSGTYSSGSMKIDAATGTTAYTAIVPTTNASDTFAMLGVGNAFTAANTITRAPAANTSIDGLILADTTAASSGNQQYSPGVHWTGQGWRTTSTAASQAVDFRSYVVPVQGSTNPSGNWTLESSVNGGSYSNGMTYSTSGQMAFPTNTNQSQVKAGTIEVQGYSLGNAWIGDNIYYTGGNFVARATGPSTQFYFFGTEGQFRSAASVSAGSVFTQVTPFKENQDGTVAIGGNISTSAGTYTGAALVAQTNLITANQPLTTAVGAKFECTHGSNATCGVATLSSGTVTVSTTAIGTLAAAAGAGYVVELTEQTCSGTCGGVQVGTVTAATSFVINGLSTDNSNVYWEIKYVN